MLNLSILDRTCRYKILGRLAQAERGLILVFDFSEAIMFAQTPVEYVDKITGLTKKRQVKYYPDEYKYKIGKSYNDSLLSTNKVFLKTLRNIPIPQLPLHQLFHY